MNLLLEIQTAAVDGASDLETVLRKCRVLAARLKHDDFKNWVQHELDGYPPGVEVPNYRKFHVQCFGHFSGAFQSGMRNAPIPESCIPQQFRKTLTCIEMRQGVGSLKSLVDGCEDGLIRYQWPADASKIFGEEIYDRMFLIQGWGNLDKSMVVGILSTVRNRILNFVLEIEASNPDAGEATPGSTPVPKETISQMFNTHIYGNVGNVATGHDIEQTATMTVQQGDFRSLATYLRDQGVDNADIDALEHAVKGEPPPTHDKRLGKKVSAWMGKMIEKAADGTWKVGTTVAANILTNAIKTYYGI